MIAIMKLITIILMAVSVVGLMVYRDVNSRLNFLIVLLTSIILLSKL